MIPTVPGLTTVAEGSPKQKLMAKLARLSKKSPDTLQKLFALLAQHQAPTGPPQPGFGQGTPTVLGLMYLQVG